MALGEVARLCRVGEGRTSSGLNSGSSAKRSSKYDSELTPQCFLDVQRTNGRQHGDQNGGRVSHFSRFRQGVRLVLFLSKSSREMVSAPPPHVQ